jgi:hypothetical protein
MFGMLKALPIMLVIAGAGYAAHVWIVDRLEDQIERQTLQIEGYQAQNVALQTAAQQNEQTIRSLEAGMKKQMELTRSLTNQFNEADARAREAMEIFKNHNFTKLARSRPGMIEPRANAATKKEFDGIEELSKEVADLENVERVENEQ